MKPPPLFNPEPTKCRLLVTRPQMNQIFAHLPSIARELIEPHVETVSLRAQKVLHRAGAPIYFVYFPNVGLVAIMIVTRDGRTVTTSLVGRDGMVSSGASLNAKTSLDEATVQVAGDAIRIPGTDFHGDL